MMKKDEMIYIHKWKGTINCNSAPDGRGTSLEKILLHMIESGLVDRGTLKVIVEVSSSFDQSEKSL